MTYGSMPFGEVAIGPRVDRVGDGFDVTVGPEKVGTAWVTAVELTLVGVVAVGAKPVVADDATGSVFTIQHDADPG